MMILDARQLCERADAHAYLKEKLHLPAYYGENLDALFDCLTELPAMEIRFIYPDEENTCYRQIRRIFDDASRENPDLTVSDEGTEGRQSDVY